MNVLNYSVVRRIPDNAVYIGRNARIWAESGRSGAPAWGNQFIIGRDGNRDDVVHKYREWLDRQTESEAFRERLLDDLAGKDLVCHCAPHACHGHVLRDKIQQLTVERPSAAVPTVTDRTPVEAAGRETTDASSTTIAGTAATAYNVAIIGTAGRQDDARRLNGEVFRAMVEDARTRVRGMGGKNATLVSGGAAYADHIAVRLFLDGEVKGLTLHLPAAFENGRFVEAAGDRYDAGRTANYYHEQFTRNASVSGLSEIREAMARGANVRITPGFKQRNTLVATEATAVLAYTFGPKDAVTTSEPGSAGHRQSSEAGLKDGGTADTWEKATRAALKVHVPITVLAKTAGKAMPTHQERTTGLAAGERLFSGVVTEALAETLQDGRKAFLVHEKGRPRPARTIVAGDAAIEVGQTASFAGRWRKVADGFEFHGRHLGPVRNAAAAITQGADAPHAPTDAATAADRDVPSFIGADRVFSNMYAAPVMWGDEVTPARLWDCNELPYMLAKTLEVTERDRMLKAYEAGKAKALSEGKSHEKAVELGARYLKKAAKGVERGCFGRPDWDQFKVPHMQALVDDKADRNPAIAATVLSTGKGIIQEGNKWGDTFWGVALNDVPWRGVKAGDGDNNLGKCWMNSRDRLERERAAGAPSTDRQRDGKPGPASTSEKKTPETNTDESPFAGLESTPPVPSTLEPSSPKSAQPVQQPRNVIVGAPAIVKPRYFPGKDVSADDADIIVNTVNCVGVMGAGVALAMKNRFPEIMPAYQEACRSGQLRPGGCLLLPLPDGRHWAALATKDHWRNPSQYDWVMNGLNKLERLAQRAGARSIAIPPPGCGNGGLNWDKVRPMVLKTLGSFDLRIYAQDRVTELQR